VVHVRAQPARPQVATRGLDEVEELGTGGISRSSMAFSIVRGHLGHARAGAPGQRGCGSRCCPRGRTSGRSMRPLVIMSKPQKVKNRCSLDALAEGGVAEDEAGVGHVEVALRADDGQLAAPRPSSSNAGTIMSCVAVMSVRLSRRSRRLGSPAM